MSSSPRSLRSLPSALAPGVLQRALGGRRPAVFLDYDGTLTPIVPRPEDARLPDPTRAAMERLRARVPLAVVSGRDLADVRRMVGVDGIWYAGSHGFDILGPRGERHRRGERHLPALDRAEEALRARLAGAAGLRVERKAFAIAVHYRAASPEDTVAAEAAVDAVVAAEPEIRKTGGKKIFELRPAIEWDKGRALLWLLAVLGLEGSDDVMPLYVGDDETDEDAFRALVGLGVGIVVRGEDDDRPTAADYRLDHPEEVRDLLDALGAAAPG